MSSENYHLWTLALNFCHILPDDESGRNGKCRWQLPLANWQHSAKYIRGSASGPVGSLVGGEIGDDRGAADSCVVVASEVLDSLGEMSR